jgi:catechol 2,3-dioxygenase-like lactoylglutathione lyase family enzyme
MYPFTYDYRYVEQHLCELRAQAERERLVRRAYRARPLPQPRHWRRWVSALLITAGEALMGRPVAEAAGPQACVGSPCGCLVTVPVADVDRAKAFYLDRLGFRLDVDHWADEDFRVVQLTPPDSACAITLMRNVEAAGSVHGLRLVVRDIAAARAWLAARGAPVGETFHVAAGEQAPGPDPHRSDDRAFFSLSDPDGNSWLVQEVGGTEAQAEAEVQA